MVQNKPVFILKARYIRNDTKEAAQAVKKKNWVEKVMKKMEINLSDLIFNPFDLVLKIFVLKILKYYFWYIYFACRFVCQNGWTDQTRIFCGTSRDPMGDLWMIKISKICIHQNSIFIKFMEILKIHNIFTWNPQTFFDFVFQCIQICWLKL